MGCLRKGGDGAVGCFETGGGAENDVFHELRASGGVFIYKRIEILTDDSNGTLLKVGLENGFGVLFKDIKIPQHVADGTISVAGLTLRVVDLLIDFDWVARIVSEHLQNPFQHHLLVFPLDQAYCRNRSGIDHGIQWLAGFWPDFMEEEP